MKASLRMCNREFWLNTIGLLIKPWSEKEYNKGDEIALYADGYKIVRNEYNPATAYAFDEVYDVAAKPAVKAVMEGAVFAYGVTSSGKTHTMHIASEGLKHHVFKVSLADLQGDEDNSFSSFSSLFSTSQISHIP